LPKGDVLIHAGDLTNQGSYSELKKTVEWLEKADFEAKIVVAGKPGTEAVRNTSDKNKETTILLWMQHFMENMARHGNGRSRRTRKNA
jgi:predicted phosphodiesterase